MCVYATPQNTHCMRHTPTHQTEFPCRFYPNGSVSGGVQAEPQISSSTPSPDSLSRVFWSHYIAHVSRRLLPLSLPFRRHLIHPPSSSPPPDECAPLKCPLSPDPKRPRPRPRPSKGQADRSELRAPEPVQRVWAPPQPPLFGDRWGHLVVILPCCSFAAHAFQTPLSVDLDSLPRIRKRLGPWTH